MTGFTSTGTSLQGLFLQYLYKTLITILCLCDLYKRISTIVYLLLSLQLSLKVSLQENILCFIYKGISTTVYLLSSLLKSLRCKVLKSSLHVSLQDDDLQSSLLESVRNRIIQTSLLTSLWSKFVLTSSLVYLLKIFLRHFYKDISTITRIHSNSEILLRYIRRFMCATKQVKSGSPKV